MSVNETIYHQGDYLMISFLPSLWCEILALSLEIKLVNLSVLSLGIKLLNLLAFSLRIKLVNYAALSLGIKLVNYWPFHHGLNWWTYLSFWLKIKWCVVYCLSEQIDMTLHCFNIVIDSLLLLYYFKIVFNIYFDWLNVFFIALFRTYRFVFCFHHMQIYVLNF